MKFLGAYNCRAPERDFLCWVSILNRNGEYLIHTHRPQSRQKSQKSCAGSSRAQGRSQAPRTRTPATEILSTTEVQTLVPILLRSVPEFTNPLRGMLQPAFVSVTQRPWPRLSIGDRHGWEPCHEQSGESRATLKVQCRIVSSSHFCLYVSGPLRSGSSSPLERVRRKTRPPALTTSASTSGAAITCARKVSECSLT